MKFSRIAVISSCGQIDPIALVGKMKGRNAERIFERLAKS